MKFFDFFFLFLLRHSKVNLQNSTYSFCKSTATTNINSVTFGTFFKKSMFCGRQISLFCGLRQHLHPPNNGWPEKHQTPKELFSYYSCCSETTYHEDILLKNQRIIVHTILPCNIKLIMH